MTIHKLTSGTGYTYLTRQVAGGDVQRQRGQSAADYYTAKGNPPGRWMGRGTGLLALDGQTVTENQMRHLFGLGQHPEADRIITAYLQEHVRAGMSDEQLDAVRAAAIKAATLGRPFPQYKALAPFEERVAARLAAIEEQAKRAPTQAEIKKIQREESGRQRAAVAGFDIVFAPVKSAAVLWALDEREHVRAAVRQAHEAAQDAALELVEQHAAFTRTGSSGQAQIETKGLIAAVFDHFDSRAGDPNLHTHVAVSSKVQGVDGKWRALDARALYAMTVAASEFYNSRFETELSARLGVTFADRPSNSGKEPVREIEGIPVEFLRHFSSRRTEIEARYEQLLRAYRAEHGRDPSTGVAHRLARQANLDTREGKKAARSLQEMRADWLKSLTEAHGSDAVRRVMAAVSDIVPAGPQPVDNTSSLSGHEHQAVNIEALAARVITAVGDQRATWTVWNVRAEAERLARTEHSGRTPEHHAQLVELVTAAALSPAHSIVVSAPSLLMEPEELRRSDGTSVFEQHASLRYTSRAVLDAEARLRKAALTTTAVGLSGPFVKAALDGFEGRNRPLDESQRALVTAFATDNRMVVVGLGPAGSGKTAAMKAYVDVAAQAGQRVVPLATSAASAAVLGKDLGLPAENLHKFLWEYTEGPAATRLQQGRAVPASRARFALRPGDVILLDEAGMAGSFPLDRLVHIAAERGAVVRLLGDYRQLAAVETGGALRDIAAAAGAVELTHLHRFTNPAEADATLKIRVGDNAGLDFYEHHDRITGGSRTAMVEAAYQDWKTDMLAGKTTLISATATIDVTALSARARADRVAAGHVEQDGVLLRDGNRAGKGDWIVTRENNRKLSTTRGRDFVKNGDSWQVLKRHRDGSLNVRHLTHGGRLTLPAGYVETHVQLLYASTVMRSQGTTVDTAHPLVTEDMTRENLYVAVSRAREKTTLYTVTHDLLPYDTDEQLDATRHDPDTFAAREVLERVLRREGAQLSATATIQNLQEEATTLATLAPRFEYAVDTLTRDHYTQLIHQTLGADLAQQIIENPAFSAVTRALRTAHAAGWQPEQLLAAVVRQGDLAADSPAQLLAWRLNHHADDHTPTAHLARPTHQDAHRYAILIATRLGVSAERFTTEASDQIPARLRTSTDAATTPAGHPYVSVDVLQSHAQHVADRLGIEAAQVIEHASWPHLAGALTAAQRAGHNTAHLLHHASSDSIDPLAQLTEDVRSHLAQKGILTAEQSVPAALRHHATAHQALGHHLTHRACTERSWPALTAALRRAENQGHEPIDLLRALAEDRPLTNADSISATLAWRLNHYLAQHPEPEARTSLHGRETETWRTLAWTLKAAEHTGITAEQLLPASSTDLPSLLTHVQHHARVSRTQLDTATRAVLPPWIPGPAPDPHMNPVHRGYLSESAKLITDRVTVFSERLTADRPAWSSALGAPPEDAALRAVWQHHLATIAAYRDHFQVTDNSADEPVGPYIEQGRGGHTAYWHATAAAMAAKQIAANPHLVTAPAGADEVARHESAADLFRTLPEADQTDLVRDLAHRTGAAWITTAGQLDDTALRNPLLAGRLAEAMAQRGHLPSEASAAVPAHAEEPSQPLLYHRQPTLAERRHAGREAERQAHREQLQQGAARPNRKAEPAQRPRQAARADQHPNRQDVRVDQTPSPVPCPLAPPPRQPRPDQQGPRIK